MNQRNSLFYLFVFNSGKSRYAFHWLLFPRIQCNGLLEGQMAEYIWVSRVKKNLLH